MKQEQMTEVDAMNLLRQLCASYKGNLAEHEMLQTALGIVGAKVFPAPLVTEQQTLKPDFKKNKTETEDSK